MEPFGEIVDQTLSNLRSDVTIPDSFSQQENDEVQAELAAVINDMLEDESFTDNAVLLDDSSLDIPSYTAPILIPENQINSKIRSLNQKQCELFGMVESWAKKSIKTRSMPDAQPLEPSHIFLTGNAGCGKSNDLLFHVHLRLTEIFGSVDDQLFVCVSVIAVVDSFQLPLVAGKLVYANYKDNWQNINSLWKLFKIFELTEVMRQCGDSQLIDLLNNVRTGDIQLDNINILNTTRCRRLP